jgi:hypothetical protein
MTLLLYLRRKTTKHVCSLWMLCEAELTLDAVSIDRAHPLAYFQTKGDQDNAHGAKQLFKIPNS